MRIAKNLDILSPKVLQKADAVCFTSNGIVKAHHRLVMGKGVAKTFRDSFLNLDWSAGCAVEENGNVCQIIRSTQRNPESIDGKTFDIVAFPTKNHWRDPSDLDLIITSATQLVKLSDELNWKLVFLPAPGCSNGKLNFEKEVKPAIEKILDNRFVITFYNNKGNYVKRKD